MPTPRPLEHDPLSFLPLFVALAFGVGAVTLVLALAVSSPVLVMTLAGALTLAFVAVVVHQVNLLLADEEPGS